MKLDQIDFYPPNGISFEKHSETLDLELGFRVQEIENIFYHQARLLHPHGNLQTWGGILHRGQQTWVGLEPQVLQTPYGELLEILNWLKPVGHLVDLGAGYGRLGFVIARYFPGMTFTGFEYVSERVLEGNRLINMWDLKNILLLQQDLTASDFFLPEADVYFLYDYGKPSHIRHTLNQLSDVANRKKFHLVARGKGVRSIVFEEFPWLSALYHGEKFSIFGF